MTAGRPIDAPARQAGNLDGPAWWAALIVLSVALGGVLLWLRVPAGLFLAPLLAGITVTSCGGDIRGPDWPFAFAQGLIGCMIANMMPPSLVGEIGVHWVLFGAGVVSVVAAGGFLGWVMARLGVMPGTTVVWGLSPGAAPAMIAMAEAYGADTQLVALMQYLRLVIVAATASAVARLWGISTLHVPGAVSWFAPIAWVPLLETVAIAALGPLAARRLRIPSLTLLLPLGAGVALTHAELMTIETPRWLLAMSYAFVGWRVGLRFTRPLLVHAAKLLPQMIACTVALIVLCGCMAGVLVAVGVEPLTAYLAMSPGGADSVAIIAASSNVDAPFVMTMQTLRFLGVMLMGPSIARFVANRVVARGEVSS